MDLGLVIPDKLGSQYNFDSRCQEDLDSVLYFKSMGFLLNEIKSIFIIKRLAQYSGYQENDNYLNLFINKKQQLADQIMELHKMKDRLETEIQELSLIENNKKSIIGVDIKALNLLCCSECGKNLELIEGSITNNQIMNGILVCSCGEEFRIEDGIIRATKNTEYDNQTGNNQNIMEYISTTDMEYLDSLYRSIELTYKKVQLNSYKNKVMLELGSGLGFFLRSIYEDIPDDTIYIAVDYDINRHILLKNLLETINYKKNLLFICTDFNHIPIKEKSVDILIDVSGTSNYSFYYTDFLLDRMDKYSKDQSELIGAYIVFKNFTSNSLINIKYRKNFLEKNIKERLVALDYKLDEAISNIIEKGGKYENYIKLGEKVYFYLVLGKR
jgi:uncharacterized protein YbaR (Trm112 family)